MSNDRRCPRALARLIALVALIAATMPVAAATALSDPWSPSVVDRTVETWMICRANGGALGGNQEADQIMTISTSAPDGVAPGESFDIIIKPTLSIFPLRNPAPIIGSATVNRVRNLSQRIQLPPTATLVSVAPTETPGSPAASPTGGYYVAPGNVPDITDDDGLVNPDPDFDPLTIPDAQRIAIPGGSSVEVQAGNVIKVLTLGTGSSGSGDFQGGSVVQQPWLKVTMIAPMTPGVDLQARIAGSTPGALPNTPPYTTTVGSQPNPNTPGSGNPSGAAQTVVPNWPNASFTTTANVTLAGNVPTACAPGHESLSGFPVPPYMQGPGALANGVAPPISSTRVVGPDEVGPDITITTPINGSYLTGAVVNVDFDCDDGQFGSGVTAEHCTAEIVGGPALLDGEAIPTGTPGTYELRVTAEDGEGNVSTESVTFDVADNHNPTASAGPDQFGRSVGRPVTLDASGSTDVDLPAQTLAYHWEQLSGAPVTLSDADVAAPTFTTPSVGPDTLVFEVTVADGAGGSATDQVTVGVIANQAPTASTGTQTAKVSGSVVSLAGSGTDADGHTLSYHWSQTGGVPVTLSNPNIANPTFTMPPNPAFVYPHVVSLTLTTDDGFGGVTTSAPLNITVNATAPSVTSVARVPSGTVHTGTSLALNPTVTNPDGGPLTYVWTQATGRTTTLPDNTLASPSFKIPSSGANPTTAACTSGTGSTSPTSANCPRFWVRVTNAGTGLQSSGSPGTANTIAAYGSSLPTRPTAAAGASQSKLVGSTVTLNGSGAQAQGHTISYAWTQTSGTPVALNDETSPTPTFTAPMTPGNLQFSLVVTDDDSPITSGSNQRASVASTTTVTVTNYPATVADAGPNQTVNVEDAGVQLDASGSTDPSELPLSFHWEQLSGELVTLSDADSVAPTFTAPEVPTTLVFRVTASNGFPGGTSTDTVTVNVVAFDAPTAAAGDDQTVLVDAVVGLDGSGSGAVPGHTLTYHWQQLSGPPVVLSDEHSATPTFTAPTVPATLGFRLTVDDGFFGGVDIDDVTINVYNTTPTADAGPSQTVASIASVILDGTASQDGDGHSLAYSWQQVSGPAVTLIGADTAQPTFTAPYGPATVGFQLTVDDGHSGESSASVSVSVLPIPGLDLASAIVANYKPETLQSSFTVKVTNPGTLQRSVPTASLPFNLTVNGASAPGTVTITQKAATLKPGNTVQFTITWAHGKDALQLGDDIALTLCVEAPGDQAPANNCSTWESLSPPLHASVDATLTQVRKTQTSNNIQVRVGNTGLGRIAPVRDTDVSLTVQVGEDPDTAVTRTVLAAPLVVGLQPAEARTFAFVWNHAKLDVGTPVTIQACVNAPNNTSAHACETFALAVTP